MLDDSISQEVQSASFEDFVDQRRYWNQISDKLIEAILKNNILTIVDRFGKSASFGYASTNSWLLVKVADYLSPIQWENILEAFFKNNQIHGSYDCYGEFESLFKKSLELNNSVQPYWLSFRQKLNKFNNKYSNSLKRLIDSHT